MQLTRLTGYKVCNDVSEDGQITASVHRTFAIDGNHGYHETKGVKNPFNRNAVKVSQKRLSSFMFDIPPQEGR
jgi:hypothetical protein